MTTDDNYSRRKMLKLTQQLVAPLSQKQKTFSGFFIAFLICALILKHLEKKYEYSSLVISKVINSERGFYLTLFVNTLTTGDKYSRRNMLNFTQ